MQKVYLNGNISTFGSYFEVSCKNTNDIFKLLACQLDGFRQYLIDAAEAGIDFEIVRGDKVITEAEHLLLSLSDEDIIITEVPSGSKGAVKIIAAAVILVVMFYTGPAGGSLFSSMTGAGASAFSQIAAQMIVGLALNLAISGITELLMSPPEVDGTSGLDDDGYLFDGPTNSLKYGQAIPVAYGELLIGGAPVSSYYQGVPLA